VALIARERGLGVEISPALDELDFGTWTGRSFGALDLDPRWLHWNRARSRTSPPGGESMQNAQQRIVSHLQHLVESYPGKCIAIATHAEIIRAAILHVMNLPLDQWSQIEVPLASITRLHMHSGTRGVITLANEMGVA